MECLHPLAAEQASLASCSRSGGVRIVVYVDYVHGLYTFERQIPAKRAASCLSGRTLSHNVPLPQQITLDSPALQCEVGCSADWPSTDDGACHPIYLAAYARVQLPAASILTDYSLRKKRSIRVRRIAGAGMHVVYGRVASASQAANEGVVILLEVVGKIAIGRLPIYSQLATSHLGGLNYPDPPRQSSILSLQSSTTCLDPPCSHPIPNFS